MPLFGPPNVKRLKAKRDVPALISALGHRDAGVRAQAAQALGEVAIGDEAAFEALAALLKSDPWEQVRHETAGALAALRDPRGVQVLADVLTNPATIASDRNSAAWALGRMGDRRAIQPLLDVLRKPDTASGAAANALLALEGGRALAALAGAFCRTGSPWLLPYLVSQGDAPALQALEEECGPAGMMSQMTAVISGDRWGEPAKVAARLLSGIWAASADRRPDLVKAVEAVLEADLLRWKRDLEPGAEGEALATARILGEQALPALAELARRWWESDQEWSWSAGETMPTSASTVMYAGIARLVEAALEARDSPDVLAPPLDERQARELAVLCHQLDLPVFGQLAAALESRPVAAG